MAHSTSLSLPFSTIYSRFRRFHIRGKRRFITTLLILSAISYVYYRLNLVNYAWYNRLRRSQDHCRKPLEEINELTKLSQDVHFVLKRLNVTHWLTYGSLWGAIRYKNPLPWDNDVDIGILRKDVKKWPSKHFANQLTASNVTVKYSHWGGFYRITRGKVRADLMVFDNFTNGLMERVGVESYVFFVNYKKMHAFPADLVEKPLPVRQFGGIDMPVPRHGLEIQKYHYPYDWWLENKPAGC